MADFRPTEIDFDVHKVIEANRTNFTETDNEVLRKLLNIDPRKHPQPQRQEGRAWVWKGVELPHGTELRMSYNGRSHLGQITNGRWIVGGREFSSPSSAAGALALTRAGTRPSLNGWEVWEVKLPGTTRWRALDSFPREKTRRHA